MEFARKWLCCRPQPGKATSIGNYVVYPMLRVGVPFLHLPRTHISRVKARVLEAIHG